MTTASRPAIQLVCLDMAGTTVEDGGAVLAAFHRALAAIGLPAGSDGHAEAVRYALDTMGRSKIEVFRHLTGGDEARAERANLAFEAAYDETVDSAGVREIPGAADAIERLRSAGRDVVLTTGFSPATRDRLLRALGWDGLVTLALSPADAGRGRPAPDLLLTALLRTRAESVHRLAAVGDTTSDLLAAHRAGARVAAAVRTGTHGDADFATVPHTHVLDSVAELPALLDGFDGFDGVEER
ncbi:HAD hydrolase-like protein [Kitasatospora sp. YST-16]|uniref:HAD family hydrolase n=1 Tax=Kitasatospora sp. YST-16 TaxID=2998080 RepID=UPI00228471B9|nr:HAD family hydrolase [Kitasatospora sp. YST-16]WAL71490.1 HAD hydrolase-like protein [Kitasatospora sp. YST-16]WNW37530.1 HAD hydrolase-like protein [Streptomyces sp. Li-HN-5-13]